MTMLARAAAFAALLTLAAVLRLEAQVGSVRFTIAGGPHAGSYRFATGQCDVLGSRGLHRLDRSVTVARRRVAAQG